MITYAQSKDGYANLWASAFVLTPYVSAARSWAQRIIDAKAQLQVGDVPWFFVGLLAMRESSLNFNTYLGNGQPLNERTTLVPAGRGPFPTFAAGAEDALNLEGFNASGNWHEIPYLLWAAEKWNGQGYFSVGINSPYVWSWTNHYTRGKYVADGSYSATAEDQQPGVAAVLGELIVMSPEIAAYLNVNQTPAQPSTGAPPVVSQANPIPTPAPTAPAPAPTPAATVAVSDPIPKIIAFLEGSKFILPGLIGMVAPQWSAGIQLAVPLVEDALQLIENAKAGQLNPKTALVTIGQHLVSIGNSLPG